MESFNLEAFLWSVTLCLWIILYFMWRRERQRARDEESMYPRVNGVGSGVEQRLRQSGISADGLGKTQYWSGKLFCACLGALTILGIQTIQAKPIEAASLMLPALIGFLLPDLWMERARRRRVSQIRSSLSFYLDLVVALLRAGLPIHRALFKAARDGFADAHPLPEEVLRIEAEIQAGKDRGTAFYALADRTGVQELRTLAAAVHVTLKQGASIEETLETQAEVMRERRREEAIKRLNRSAAMAVLPVFLCGIPIFAVVVYFPAFLEILETLQNLRIF